MVERPHPKKPPQWARMILGYSVGTVFWLLGAHCLEGRSAGSWAPSFKKALGHWLKLLGWTLGSILLGHGFHYYFVWFLDADPGQRFLALLGKTVLFLYIRLFWPGLLTRLLPALHEFFCPQCYRKHVFRFLPVSGRFGNWVTYLCPNCSCLVDAWGGQIFYPQKSPAVPWSPGSAWVPAGALCSLALGIYLGGILIKLS